MEIISKVKDIFAKPLTSSSLVDKKEGALTKTSLLAKMIAFDSQGNPEDKWERIDEIGGGTEAIVYKVKRIKTHVAQVNGTKSDIDNGWFGNGQFAAVKVITIEDEDEVDKCSLGSHRFDLKQRRLDRREFEEIMEEELSGYITELTLLRKCSHDNVVRLFETYLHGGKIWMVEELCEAGALDKIVAKSKTGLDEMSISYVCRCLLRALQYLHRSVLIVHRDIKASNVMLTLTGDVKLGDFGVAKLIQSTKSRCYSFIGSSYWMAPEVIVCETHKAKGYSFNVDVWSLGITAIEMAELDPPHHTMNQHRVLIRILRHGTPSLVDPDRWSETFVKFLNACLTVDPETRPQAEELLNVLPFVEERPQQNANLIKLIEQSLTESNNDLDRLGLVDNMMATEFATNEQSRDDVPGNPIADSSDGKDDEWRESDEDDSVKSLDITPGHFYHKPLDDTRCNVVDDYFDDSGPVILKGVRMIDDISPKQPLTSPEQSLLLQNIKDLDDILDAEDGNKFNMDQANVDKVAEKSVFPSIRIQTSSIDVYDGMDYRDLRSSNSTMDLDCLDRADARQKKANVLSSESDRSGLSTPLAASGTDQYLARVSPIEALPGLEQLANVIAYTLIDAVISSDCFAPSIPDIVLSFFNDISNGPTGAHQLSMSASDYETVYQHQFPVTDIRSATDYVQSSETVIGNGISQLAISTYPGRLTGQVRSYGGGGRSPASICDLGETSSSRFDTASASIPSRASASIKNRRILPMSSDRRRCFRKMYQTQERRLEQLKMRQQAELKSKDVFNGQNRQKIEDRFAIIEADIAADQIIEISRTEETMNVELKSEGRRRQIEMDKEIKRFKDSQKEELKTARKAEVNAQSVKELEERILRRIEQFEWSQRREFDRHMRNVYQYHAERLTALKYALANRMRNLKKDQVKQIYELEEKEITERFHALCCHVKEFYTMMRNFMLANQKKELEELDESNMLERELAITELNSRKKTFLKYSREMAKAREKQYQNELALYGNFSSAEEKCKVKQFSQTEQLKLEHECKQRDKISQEQISQLFNRHHQQKEHLHQVQAMKRAKCSDKENQKLEEVQVAYTSQLRHTQSCHQQRMMRLQTSFVPPMAKRKTHTVLAGNNHYGVPTDAHETSSSSNNNDDVKPTTVYTGGCSYWFCDVPKTLSAPPSFAMHPTPVDSRRYTPQQSDCGGQYENNVGRNRTNNAIDDRQWLIAGNVKQEDGDLFTDVMTMSETQQHHHHHQNYYSTTYDDYSSHNHYF